MPRIGVILGSTARTASPRPSRRAWSSSSRHTARSTSSTWPRWTCRSTTSPPAAAGEPVHEHTKAWGRRVEPLDAFVIVTPEYNAGYPAVLKNAIDFPMRGGRASRWRSSPRLAWRAPGHDGS